MNEIPATQEMQGNISGIVAVTDPQNVEQAINELSELAGVEVHHHDEQGRMVITQVAATVGDEVAGLKAIQALPSVQVAEMVYHYFENSFDDQGGLCEAGPDAIPESLKDTPGPDHDFDHGLDHGPDKGLQMKPDLRLSGTSSK